MITNKYFKLLGPNRSGQGSSQVWTAYEQEAKQNPPSSSRDKKHNDLDFAIVWFSLTGSRQGLPSAPERRGDLLAWCYGQAPILRLSLSVPLFSDSLSLNRHTHTHTLSLSLSYPPALPPCPFSNPFFNHPLNAHSSTIPLPLY